MAHSRHLRRGYGHVQHPEHGRFARSRSPVHGERVRPAVSQPAGRRARPGPGRLRRFPGLGLHHALRLLARPLVGRRRSVELRHQRRLDQVAERGAIGVAVPLGRDRPRKVARGDTGHLVYDKAVRTYIIRAAKAAGAVGYFRKAETGAMDVELVANDHGFATILLTALDNRPLAQSRRMLLSTPGYTLGTGQKLA